VHLGLIDALESVIDRLDWQIRQHARSDPRVKVLTQLPGIGPFTALVILAEIGDAGRFGSARKLAAWAGLTPTVRGSDRIVVTAMSPSKARPGCGLGCLLLSGLRILIGSSPERTGSSVREIQDVFT
jgi:Transposase IS116/IS110/IS902 family